MDICTGRYVKPVMYACADMHRLDNKVCSKIDIEHERCLQK